MAPPFPESHGTIFILRVQCNTLVFHILIIYIHESSSLQTQKVQEVRTAYDQSLLMFFQHLMQWVMKALGKHLSSK